MNHNIESNALTLIAHTIKECADIVGQTMGASGKNVLLQEQFEPFTSTTNDGATIIEKLSFTEPIAVMAHSLVKEVTNRSNKNAGDGSSTTVVLLDAILTEACNPQMIDTTISPMEIKQSLDACMPLITQSIHDQTKIIDVDGVTQVATIAGESEETGKLLHSIYSHIGKDGIIHVEGSGTYTTSVQYIDGVRFPGTGYLSPFMVHDEAAEKEGRSSYLAVYEKPTILVTKRKIQTINDINPLLSTLETQQKKDLIIFTDDMDSGVASLLVQLHKSKVMNVLVIKAPILWKQYVFEDFAQVVGATIVEDASGITWKNLELGHLGTCDKIVVSTDECVVIGGADIRSHIAILTDRDDTDSQLRLSWLTTHTAILKLGAASETELSYKRLKMEDAIHASRLALQSGIVPGGGVALLTVCTALPDTIGGRILKSALTYPFLRIIGNAGIEANLDALTDAVGYNVRTGKLVNMFEDGIVDSSEVVLNAVRNALGVVSTVLTISHAITLPLAPVEITHSPF